MDSRTKRRISGIPITRQEYLLAYMADRIANLVWMQSEDGYKHQNQPKMILPQLLGMHDKEPESAASSGYDSAEDFESALNDFSTNYGV